MKTLSAIPIQAPMIDDILDGTKKWEIRSKFTKKIGPVALIRSKSLTVVGTATLSEVIQLTPELAYENTDLMGFRPLTREEARDSMGNMPGFLKM